MSLRSRCLPCLTQCNEVRSLGLQQDADEVGRLLNGTSRDSTGLNTHEKIFPFLLRHCRCISSPSSNTIFIRLDLHRNHLHHHHHHYLLPRSPPANRRQYTLFTTPSLRSASATHSHRQRLDVTINFQAHLHQRSTFTFTSRHSLSASSSPKLNSDSTEDVVAAKSRRTVRAAVFLGPIVLGLSGALFRPKLRASRGPRARTVLLLPSVCC